MFKKRRPENPNPVMQLFPQTGRNFHGYRWLSDVVQNGLHVTHTHTHRHTSAALHNSPAELFFSEQDCIRRHFRTLANLKTFGILTHKSKIAIAGVLQTFSTVSKVSRIQQISFGCILLVYVCTCLYIDVITSESHAYAFLPPASSSRPVLQFLNSSRMANLPSVHSIQLAA